MPMARKMPALSATDARTDGTAIAPADYASATGTLSWAAGDITERTITIPIVADGLAEPDETFSVTLSVPVGATLGATKTITIAVKKN